MMASLKSWDAGRIYPQGIASKSNHRRHRSPKHSGSRPTPLLDQYNCRLKKAAAKECNSEVMLCTEYAFVTASVWVNTTLG